MIWTSQSRLQYSIYILSSVNHLLFSLHTIQKKAKPTKTQPSKLSLPLSKFRKLTHASDTMIYSHPHIKVRQNLSKEIKWWVPFCGSFLHQVSLFSCFYLHYEHTAHSYLPPPSEREKKIYVARIFHNPNHTAFNNGIHPSHLPSFPYGMRFSTTLSPSVLWV